MTLQRINNGNLTGIFAQTSQAEPSTASPIIKRILLVGALTDHYDPAALLRSDREYLEEAATLLKERFGRRIAGDAEIDVCNKIYGDDFFDIDRPYDVVVFCNLHHVPDHRLNDDFMAAMNADPQALSQSEKANDPAAWKHVFEKIRPSVVLNIGFERYESRLFIDDALTYDAGMIAVGDTMEFGAMAMKSYVPPNP